MGWGEEVGDGCVNENGSDGADEEDENASESDYENHEEVHMTEAADPYVDTHPGTYSLVACCACA